MRKSKLKNRLVPPSCALPPPCAEELHRRQFNQAFRAINAQPRNLHYWYLTWLKQPAKTRTSWQHYATQAAWIEFGIRSFRRSAKRNYKTIVAATGVGVDVLARRAQLQQKEVYKRELRDDADCSVYERRRNVKSRLTCFLNSLFWATGRTARDYDQLLARKRSHRLLSNPHWWF